MAIRFNSHHRDRDVVVIVAIVSRVCLSFKVTRSCGLIILFVEMRAWSRHDTQVTLMSCITEQPYGHIAFLMVPVPYTRSTTEQSSGRTKVNQKLAQS